MTTQQISSPGATTGAARALYLLIGQSNMAGRGLLDDESIRIHPRVFAWSRDERWVPARDPLHWDKPEARVGPGLAFGVAMADADLQRVVGLIPGAVGGTAISLWTPDTQDPVTKAFPYDDALRRARAAQRDGTLAAILWHQGEGDRSEEARPFYAERLKELIARLRVDLAGPDVPFIAGELAQLDERHRQATSEINAALNSLVGRVANYACVSAAGLRDGGDHLHLDAASARELGRRYAAAVLGQTWPVAVAG